tara:strand:+ start:154 stop:939 length:786 start_codon:yes stop_codon:yes gene_type:complete
MEGISNLFWCTLGWALALFPASIFLADNDLGIFVFPILIIFAAWLYLTFSGSEKRAEKAFLKLADILMEGEGLLAKGADSRPFALFSRRQIFGITNSRVIRLKRGLLGGFTMEDFQWKDLIDAQISEHVLSSVCGTKLFFNAQSSSTSNPLQLTMYPSTKTGRYIYKVSQKQEQAWEEKRRVREMEETRAAAGGVMFTGSNAPSLLSQHSNSEPTAKSDSFSLSIADELIKLKNLVADGIIDDVEFEELKAKLLSKGTQNF